MNYYSVCNIVLLFIILTILCYNIYTEESFTLFCKNPQKRSKTITTSGKPVTVCHSCCGSTCDLINC